MILCFLHFFINLKLFCRSWRSSSILLLRNGLLWKKDVLKRSLWVNNKMKTRYVEERYLKKRVLWYKVTKLTILENDFCSPLLKNWKILHFEYQLREIFCNDSYKYLGMLLKSNMNMTDHVQHSISKASLRVYLLRKNRTAAESLIRWFFPT